MMLRYFSLEPKAFTTASGHMRIVYVYNTYCQAPKCKKTQNLECTWTLNTKSLPRNGLHHFRTDPLMIFKRFRATGSGSRTLQSSRFSNLSRLARFSLTVPSIREISEIRGEKARFFRLLSRKHT
jgi:hypothetical protein